MVFSDLTAEAQTYLIASHGYLTKWFVYLLLVFFASYYLFYMRKEQKPTPYFTVGFLRIFFLCVSYSFLLTLPFTILLMTPEYDFYDFYLIPFMIFKILLGFIVIFWLIDFFRLTPLVLLKLAGMDMQDKNVDRIASMIEKNKLMRFGSNGRK